MLKPRSLPDSLADQIYSVIQSSVIDSKDDLFVLHPSIERIYNITINKNHPMAQRLAQDAGVTLDRLDRPIFNYWREHHLIHREELDAVLSGSPGYEPWTGGSSLAENGWIWDRSWWFERWNWLLDQVVELGPRASDGEVPKEENSVISFSTGPHWTTVELWPKEWHRTDTTDDLLKGFKGAVSRSQAKSRRYSARYAVSCSGRHGYQECDRGLEGAQSSLLVAKRCCRPSRMSAI